MQGQKMAQNTLHNLLQSKTVDLNDSMYKPVLLDFQPKSKNFIAARNKLAQSNK